MTKKKKMSKLRQRTAETIKQKRQQAGLEVDEAAKKVGVSAIAWYKWEAGEKFPRAENLVAIARVLKCDVGDLLD